MAITISTTDPQVYRIATRVAEHEREITGVQTHARRQDREINDAKAQVRRVRAEVRTKGATGNAGTRAALGRRGVGVDGVSVSARGSFSMAPQKVLGGGGAFLLFGATQAAASAVRWWEDEGQAVADKYGTGEALGRFGRGALRQVFVTPAEAFADTLSLLLYRNKQSRSEYMRRFKDFWRQPPAWARIVNPFMNLIAETPAEYAERRAREHANIEEAGRRAVEFVDRNFTQPINRNAFEASAVVRTSGEARAIKAELWRVNEKAADEARRKVYEAELNTLNQD